MATELHADLLQPNHLGMDINSSLQPRQTLPLKPAFIALSYDVGFNPSTQRHYRRLIYYLYIHSYMFRSYDHHQPDDDRTTETCSNII
jgi:hypothetical protein